MKTVRVYKNEFGKYSIIVNRTFYFVDSFVDEDEIYHSLEHHIIVFEDSYSTRSFVFFKILQKKPFNENKSFQK